jgi:hypothetical protein
VRTPVDAEEFMDKLWKQKRALFDQFNREPQQLIIGADDYEQMMHCENIRQLFTFNASYNYGRNEIYGLKITVIPWMRGICVMP